MHEAANGVMNKLGLLEAQRDFYRKIKWTCQSSQQWKRGWDGGGIYCFYCWIRSRRQSEYVYTHLHKRTMRLNKCWFVGKERKGGEQSENKRWVRIRNKVTLLCCLFCCCCCYLFNPLLFFSVFFSKWNAVISITLNRFFVSFHLEWVRQGEKRKKKKEVCEKKVTGVLFFLSWNSKIKVLSMKEFTFAYVHTAYI